MKFAKFALAGAAAAGLAFAAFPTVSTFAKEATVTVGGAAMYPTKDIIDNAVNSKDHTTLVTAVKAAGLVETLKGKVPFTVFAPTNDAFAKIPKAQSMRSSSPKQGEAHRRTHLPRGRRAATPPRI